MTNEPTINGGLSDTELLDEVKRLIAYERLATARLIAALAELDVRKLYVGEGCSSLFTYCTQVLHLSEHAAYGRIEAARAARKWPALLELLADGSVHLTAVTLLAPHFTTENHRELLAVARHKSKREVEDIVAALRPRPPVPSSVRTLPVPKAPPLVANSPTDVPSAEPCVSSTGAQSAPAPSPLPEVSKPFAQIKPLAPEHYKVQFTVSRETHDKLRQAQDLLRHRVPNGDVAAIFDRALTLLLADLQRTKHAATDRPRSSPPRGSRGRYIPAVVKREIWERDGGRCAFVGTAGRCSERGFLEYHHVVPFADGGATTAENLQLRCRSHNSYEAERITPLVTVRSWNTNPSPFEEKTKGIFDVSAYSSACWMPSPTLQ
jgi:5-methylcytosine-specific restriction endonuclease McrA